MKKYLLLVAVLLVALVVPASSVAAEDTTLVPYKLSGWFVADAKPGSDPFWDQLESGSFSGTYYVPEGAFPANSGTSFEIFEFEISLRDPAGDVVIEYASGTSFAGFFADFFGPGSGDGFVFADGSTQFQLGFASGFDGSGVATTGAVFGGTPAGEIQVDHALATAGTDVQPPSVDVGFPFGGTFAETPVLLFGTAGDDTGIEKVRIAIRERSSGLWLQDDMVSFGPFNRFPAMLSDPGSMATGWSFTVGLDDGEYLLSVRATDLVGNEASVAPWHYFVVRTGDSIPPVVEAGYAQDTVFKTDPVVLTGTASDDVGVGRVRVAIRHRATGYWLQADMAQFAPRMHRFDAVLSDPRAAATTWSFAVSLPDGGYTTSVRATDLAGNEQSISPWRRFAVTVVDPGDSIPPVVDAGYAQDTVFKTDPVVLTGTASDDVGVGRVRVAIRHRATGYWLQADMATFAPRMHRFDAVLSDPRAAATTWSFAVSLPDGGYTTSVRATDLAGNEQSISPWRRFAVNT